MQKGLKNVAFVFGGMSSENEISVLTGVMAANVADREKFVPYPVYLSQSGKMYTGKAYITTFSLSTPAGDNATYSYSLTGSGNLTPADNPQP